MEGQGGLVILIPSISFGSTIGCAWPKLHRQLYSTHRLAVDKEASLSFVGDVKLAAVFQLDHPLSPRDLPSRTFQLEVDINFLTLSRPTKSYLKQIKKIFSKFQIQ